MNNIKRRAVIDDGCCPKLVQGARFDGIFEIPIIEKPNIVFTPNEIIPFSQAKKVEASRDVAIGFYEMDKEFSDILISPEKYVSVFQKFGMIISPDCSLYRDAPLAVQITNVYRNRAIGYFFQRKGLYVVPQIRWGNEETYTTRILPERVAFLGVPQKSIVAIGTYGCSQSKNDKYHQKAGLEAMLETLDPALVLVYGPMAESIFGDYLHSTQFIHYDNWISKKHGGES